MACCGYLACGAAACQDETVHEAACIIRWYSDNGSEVDNCTVYDVDQAGLVVGQRVYFGGCLESGASAACSRFRYDSKERVVEQRLDSGCDGVVDEVFSYTYGAENRLASQREEQFTADPPECQLSQITWVETGPLDVEGTESLDLGCDGTIDDDEWACHRITYDSTGRVVQRTRYWNCNLSYPDNYRFEYDPQGRMIISQRDSDGDDVPDDCFYLTYDGVGRLTREILDYSCSNTAEQNAEIEGDCFDYRGLARWRHNRSD